MSQTRSMSASEPDARRVALPAAGVPDGDQLALLRMVVGGAILALPIANVREILQAPRLTPLPRTPVFMRGVMNLRGAVVPVIDLAVRLADPHGEARDIAPSPLSRRSCVVVVELRAEVDADDADHAPAPLVLGLLVDAVHEVFDVEPTHVDAVPPLGTAIDAPFLEGMVRARDEVVPLLALSRALAAHDLAALIERHGHH